MLIIWLLRERERDIFENKLKLDGPKLNTLNLKDLYENNLKF